MKSSRSCWSKHYRKKYIYSIKKQVSVEGHPNVNESIMQFNFKESSDSNVLNKTEEWREEGEKHDNFTTPFEVDNEEIII